MVLVAVNNFEVRNVWDLVGSVPAVEALRVRDVLDQLLHLVVEAKLHGNHAFYFSYYWKIFKQAKKKYICNFVQEAPLLMSQLHFKVL